MIEDVDASIRMLLRRDALNGDVEVAFDLPNAEWASRRSAPTVDVYLFDITEDLARRRVEAQPVRDADGTVIGRRRPPRRYRLSYMITAWTNRPEDEHRLLSAVLHAFLPHEEFPADTLEGSLAEQDAPLYLTLGQPPPEERSIEVLWSALGSELKPSIDLVLSVPFPVDELRLAGPPVEETPRFEFDVGEGRVEHAAARGEDEPEKRTDDGISARDDAADPERLEETVVAGTEDAPGRMVTVSTMRRRP